MPPLDELYFRWLYGLVAPVEETEKSLTYWKLLKQLFTIEFLWLIPRDENRLEDGQALRKEFLAEQGIDVLDVDPDWMDMGCSVLELMVGLSRHLAFEDMGETPGSPHYWFWRLVENVGLRSYNDGVRRYPRQHIEDTIYAVIFRQYTRHGLGGFFPLEGPCEDQRGVELWYQLSAYVLEQT